MKAGEWTTLYVYMPELPPEPAGVLLLDKSSNRLHVKLADSLSGDDETLLIVWTGLSEDLLEKAQEVGGAEVLAWLEETASHVIRLGGREEVQFREAQEAVERLFREHIHQAD